MSRLILLQRLTLGCLLVVSCGHNLHAQAAATMNPSCVILKRMGPADQVTSRLYSVGIRGKQFQYQAGTLPEGIKFHGRLTDRDVRAIQDGGGRVEIINDHYTDQELTNARRSCNLSITDLSTPAPKTPEPVAATEASAVTIKSTPDGADITIDGMFSGSTPSKLQLAGGSHTILVEQTGYIAWQRTIAIAPGNDISVNAVLAKAPEAR